MKPVLNALHNIGIPAEFSGRNYILIGGRKISGTAQYKLAGNTVHHGSILFDSDIEQMVRVTTVDREKFISKSIKSVREHVTNIKEHLPVQSGNMNALEFKNRLSSEILEDEVCSLELTDKERAECEILAEKYFRPWTWRFRANPEFLTTKEGRFSGGKIRISLDVKNEIIIAAAIHGNFFANESAEKMSSILTGYRLQRESIMERLNK